jgi:hypothetical protein
MRSTTTTNRSTTNAGTTTRTNGTDYTSNDTARARVTSQHRSSRVRATRHNGGSGRIDNRNTALRQKGKLATGNKRRKIALYLRDEDQREGRTVRKTPNGAEGEEPENGLGAA